jgi:hypothetical protein
MKSQLSSPLKNAFGMAAPEHTTEPGSVVDHNACPAFASPPRAPGHGGVPEVFFAGVVGQNFHGAIEGKAATINTTMQSGRKK